MLGLPATKSNCQSPIEWRLMYALQRALPRDATLTLQAPIGNCHVDLLVVCGALKIAIEADGADWHREFAHVARDVRRDEFITSQGYRVMRFEGREIVRGANECAARVVEAIGGAAVRTPAPKKKARKAKRPSAAARRHEARRLRNIAAAKAHVGPQPRRSVTLCHALARSAVAPRAPMPAPF